MRGTVGGLQTGGEPDDAELIAWVQSYGPGLRRFFARRVGQSDADELVQDVFLAMHARSADLRVENPQGYLFSAARRLLARRRCTDKPEDGDEDVDTLFDLISPERRLIGKQELDKALVAIENLPPRTKEAFILHRFEEMTYPNIARHLGISVSGVKKLISRALHHIIAAIGKPQ